MTSINPCPSLSVCDLMDRANRDSEHGGYLFIANSLLQESAYFTHLIFVKFRAAIIVPPNWPSQSRIVSVLAIFSTGAPFKIVPTIVGLISVYVVNFMGWARRFSMERLGYQTMHNALGLTPADSQTNHHVSARPDPLREQAVVVEPTASTTVKPWDRPDLPKTRDFVRAFKPKHWPPFFHRISPSNYRDFTNDKEIAALRQPRFVKEYLK